MLNEELLKKKEEFATVKQKGQEGEEMERARGKVRERKFEKYSVVCGGFFKVFY